MRLFFVIALLSALGGAYLFKKGNERQVGLLREQCQAVEAEIKQCETAEKVIRQEQRQKSILAAENKRLKALVKQKHK